MFFIEGIDGTVAKIVEYNGTYERIVPVGELFNIPDVYGVYGIKHHIHESSDGMMLMKYCMWEGINFAYPHIRIEDNICYCYYSNDIIYVHYDLFFFDDNKFYTVASLVAKKVREYGVDITACNKFVIVNNFGGGFVFKYNDKSKFLSYISRKVMLS